MNVGIATFQWADNYGAVIQAFAVQQLIASRGHQVQLIDFRPPLPSWPRRVLSTTPSGFIRKWDVAQKRRMFEQFRNAHLRRTPHPILSGSGVNSLANTFDLLAVGSDQVWNPKWLEQIPGACEWYTLSWAAPHVKKISMSASFGHSSTDTMSPAGRSVIAAAIRNFHALSVREKSGVALVHALCGRDDAVWLADPTLLIDPSGYQELLGKATAPPPAIFSYILHDREKEVMPILTEAQQVLSLPLIRCDLIKTARHAGYEMPSPQGWLLRIQHAPLVVTNSFHCTVFCLLFHTPFIAVPVSGSMASMNNRITELLAAVGLQDRWISTEHAAPLAGTLASTIDWQHVDARLGEYRQQGDAFLRDAGL